MKNILITGGTGFIGSHTVVELLSSSSSVHILDNLSNSDESMLDRIAEITGTKPEFTKIDLRNKTAVMDFFADHNSFDGVIHFAALKSVGESVKNPTEYYDNNIQGLLNLLEGMSIHQTTNLVFSSSSTVYGSPDELPVRETSPIGNTPSPYGATKQMCERIINDFTIANPWMKAISLRYFNPIGAHESGLIGELPTGIPNNLMPYITQTAAGVRDQLSVFGDDYDTPDGTGVRDYIHVCDLADAHVKAIDFLVESKEHKHHKINIGTGHGLSVLDVIKSFEKTSNTKLNYTIAPRREGDVGSVYADASLAKQVLGWEAKYDIDEMTRSAWKWEKKLRGI